MLLSHGRFLENTAKGTHGQGSQALTPYGLRIEGTFCCPFMLLACGAGWARCLPPTDRKPSLTPTIARGDVEMETSEPVRVVGADLSGLAIIR